MTPHRFLRPRTGLPSMMTLRSDPTTANGIISCWRLSYGTKADTVEKHAPESSYSVWALHRHSHQCRKGKGWYCGREVHRESMGWWEHLRDYSHKRLTRRLNRSLSSKVKVSAFAITGTTLTTSLNFFMTMMSIGRRECPVGFKKNRQQWIRVSWM